MSRERLLLRPQGGGAPAELPQRGRLILGSDPERADFVLEGQGVEGVHCAIGRLKSGGWAIKDLGSEFGTLVNGKPASTAKLAHGDVLVLGSRRLTVEDPEAGITAAPGAAPPPAAKSPATAPPVDGAPSTQPSAPAPSAQPRASTSPRRAEGPPQLSGYTIQKQLGKGATGTVWLARQESLQREVAVKVLSPRRAADGAFVERFQAEARAAASLNHPNVVHVYDVGEQDGVHYLSMEYMDAGCLESRLARGGPLPWREALGVLADGARALEYAASRGLVHRDVKPANLMQGSDGRTRLADLGLATSAEEIEVEQGGKRKLVGTPQFLAPEVIRGAAATPSSDLYSLGATLHRLLSGKSPFPGEKATEVLKAVLQQEPADLRERVPGLPEGVAQLVERMMARNPVDRPASAGVVIQLAEQLLAGESLPTGATDASSSSGPPLLLLGALGAAAAVAGWWFLGRTPDPPEPRPGPTPPEVRPSAPTVPEVPSGQESVTPEVPQDAPPSDDDGAEQAFEQRAALEMQVLESQEWTEAERLAELERIRTSYPGTSAATQAQEAIQALEAAEAARNAAANTQLDALEPLRTAALASIDAALAQNRPQVASTLVAIQAVPGQDALATDSTFQGERNKRLEQVLGLANEQVTRFEGSLRAALEQGDLDAAEAATTAFLAVADPTLPVEGEDPRLTNLRASAAKGRTFLEDLPSLRRAQAEANRAGAWTGLASALGTPGSAAGALAIVRSGELAAAAAALRALDATGLPPEAALRLSELAEDCERGHAGLGRLVQAFKAPGWDRRKVLTFEGGQQRSYETLGCSAEGLVVDEDGQRRDLGWAPFMGSRRAMQALLEDRLSGGWPPSAEAERQALIRLAAILETATLASELLADERVRESELEDLLEPLSDLAPSGIEPSWTARERAAAQELANAVLARTTGSPVLESHHLEQLLETHGGSLLVVLLHGPPAEER